MTVIPLLTIRCTLRTGDEYVDPTCPCLHTRCYVTFGPTDSHTHSDLHLRNYHGLNSYTTGNIALPAYTTHIYLPTAHTLPLTRSLITD